MKLGDWFKIRNPDGSRRLKGHFAERIGVSAPMISEYIAGTVWPGRETMEAIARETGGEVTANDFLQSESAA